MGKRSDFERIEKDFYATIDPRAVAALAPHLPQGTKFAEPCAGAGDLIVSLEGLGHECWWSSDIGVSPYAQMDALDLTEFEVSDCDMIITNPPWSRPLLHKMIIHFSRLRPTWLLFDADWAHTRQSAAYMHLCTDIVSIGRLIWIPGTTMTGKDNCAFYRFALDKEGPTKFHGRS